MKEIKEIGPNPYFRAHRAAKLFLRRRWTKAKAIKKIWMSLDPDYRRQHFGSARNWAEHLLIDACIQLDPFGNLFSGR